MGELVSTQEALKETQKQLITVISINADLLRALQFGEAFILRLLSWTRTQGLIYPEKQTDEDGFISIQRAIKKAIE